MEKAVGMLLLCGKAKVCGYMLCARQTDSLMKYFLLVLFYIIYILYIIYII